MGRRHEALDIAVAGQLWGPALVLAYGYGRLRIYLSALLLCLHPAPGVAAEQHKVECLA